MDYNLKAYTLKLSETEWNKYLELFDDASVYQTNAFAKYSKGGKNIEHFILKSDNEVISVAMIRIIKIPIIKRGLAYIRWAPLWQKKNNNINIEVFDLALKNLINEYVIKRKFILRIISGHFFEEDSDFKRIFEKYSFNLYKGNDKTVILDLSNDEEKLRANFRKQWRYSLKNTEKLGLTVVQSDTDEAFNLFLSTYKSMHTRKQFKEFIDVESFKYINAELLSEQKMQIFICKHNDMPLSTVVISAMGNSGIYLLGGSNDEGLKVSASYLLQWEVIKWLKSKGIRWYNLGGIDPVNGPGVYTFKTGMGGKEVNYLGGFELSKDWLSSIILRIIKLLKK